MPQRAILHLDLDAFFVSVEQLKNPALRGKPVIVGGSSERGVVAACSYEARKFGVHSAMPSVKAKQLCPQAIFVKGNFESYGHYSGIVTDILEEHAPVLEKASIDEFYVDMTGMDRFFGTMLWATELKQKIVKETGLSISFGLSSSKTVSKMACSEYKPNGQVQIAYGQECAFLHPLDVNRIPMVGAKTERQLKVMGIDRIGILAQTPVRLLEKELGTFGRSLWHKANGRCNSPVEPYSERKGMSTENTFHADTDDVEFLHKELTRMVMELTYDLRRHQETTGCLTVKVRYSNFDTHTHQVSLPGTSSDRVLIAEALKAFEKLYSRGAQVRLIGVRFTKLSREGVQLALFDDSSRLVPLDRALDKIRDRYGMDAVRRAINQG